MLKMFQFQIHEATGRLLDQLQKTISLDRPIGNLNMELKVLKDISFLFLNLIYCCCRITSRFSSSFWVNLYKSSTILCSILELHVNNGDKNNYFTSQFSKTQTYPPTKKTLLVQFKMKRINSVFCLFTDTCKNFKMDNTLHLNLYLSPVNQDTHRAL